MSLRRSDGEEAPFAGHALQLVRAAVFGLKPRPDHEVAQRAGHEHVVRPCQSAHPRPDVHADPTDVADAVKEIVPELPASATANDAVDAEGGNFNSCATLSA